MSLGWGPTPIRPDTEPARQMPHPGDNSPGFFVAPGRCFRMIYSAQLQSTHCYEPAPWRGRLVDAKGKVHRVWSRVHLFVQRPDWSFTGRQRVGTTIGETGGSRLVEVPTSGATAPPLSREAAGQSAHRVFGPNTVLRAADPIWSYRIPLLIF